MSIPAAPPPSSSIRVRRIMSVVLSGSSAFVAVAVLFVFATRNEVVLGEGTRSLPAWQAASVDALGFLPFAALTALLLATAMPPHEPVDGMPARLPLAMSLAALALVGAALLFPGALVALSLLSWSVSGGLAG